MLVTFKTKAYADITMFGDVAIKLLKLMGHSGTVPSAILPEDIPAAVERLRSAISELPPDTPAPATGAQKTDEEAEPPVSLRQRAFPLIQLLEAAAAAETPVTWQS